MKKLTEPDSSKADKLLDKVISRKKNEGYINSLNANKAYIIRRYSVYETENKNLEKIGLSAITSENDKEAIHSAFNTAFKKNIKKKELNLIYEKCQGVCPYCGDGRLEEVDHYVPKEEYPEFTLYPGNLIPLCNKCNKKKGAKFLDNTNKRQFINFYYDDIDNIDFLKIDITYNPFNIRKTIKIEYSADFMRISDIYLRDIVLKHYDNLSLLERYEDAAVNEISELLMVVINQSNREEDDIKLWATMTIEGNMKGQLKKAGKNDWKYLLYSKLLEINFINDLILYVKR